MKFIDLKCPNCGGRLLPVAGNTKIVACEYCQSQYILEDDRVINYHIHQHMSPQSGENKQNTAANATGILYAVAVLAGVALLFVVGVGSGGRNSSSSGLSERSAFSPAMREAEEASNDYSTFFSPFYEALVNGIYGRPVEAVTEEELAKLRYLSIQKGQDVFLVNYSFVEPYGDAKLAVQSLELAPTNWNTEDLAYFPNLEKLELPYRWVDKKILKELENLKGLSCHSMSPRELAEWLEPGQLVELRIEKPESLDGLSAFENLEILSLADVQTPDLRQLTPLVNLRSLTIVEREAEHDPFSDEPSYSITDYSPLSVLTKLESLHLESKAIREISFLKSLTGLKELSLNKTETISMESLAGLSQLTALELTGNHSLKDYDFIPSLTGLHSLILDKSTSQPDPDLSVLSQLESLDISGLMSVAPLGRLTNLKSLSIHGCNIDEIQAISSLTNLERLACYSAWTYAVPLQNVSFLDGMTNLKYLDLCGVSEENSWSGYGRKMEIFGDISHALNHVGLEELYLNESMFGIDFDCLQENISLKKLYLKEVDLKQNFYVEVYSGMRNVWYDDMSLDEYTDFLKNYPNLEELFLDGNQLTNIEFVSALKKLTHLGLSNNYVTDLTPLNQAESLCYLDIRQNPIQRMPESGEEIEIVR